MRRKYYRAVTGDSLGLVEFAEAFERLQQQASSGSAGKTTGDRCDLTCVFQGLKHGITDWTHWRFSFGWGEAGSPLGWSAPHGGVLVSEGEAGLGSGSDQAQAMRMWIMCRDRRCRSWC